VEQTAQQVAAEVVGAQKRAFGKGRLEPVGVSVTFGGASGSSGVMSARITTSAP
jgi:hypothetical protein